MRRGNYLLIALFVAAVFVAQGCGQPATELSPTTPVETERPEPTATPEPTQVTATDEPMAEPTESEPTPAATEAPDEPTATAEPEEPTATAEPEEATATVEPEEPTPTPEPTAEPAEQEGQALLETRCTACHSLDRVERAQKSRQEWASTVDRMVGYGVQLSESERAMLLDYLVEMYGP